MYVVYYDLLGYVRISCGNYKMMFMMIFILFWNSVIVAPFYVSSLAPVNYCDEKKVTENCQSRVALYVNNLSSEEDFIPYEYNHFDFCSANESSIGNLGQMIFGEKIQMSPYNISFLKNVDCALVCKKNYDLKNPGDVAKLNTLKKGMLKNYQHHWIVDGMPVAQCYTIEGNQPFCSTGFPIGCYVDLIGRRHDDCVKSPEFKQPDSFYLFNHVDIIIFYHSGEEESWGLEFRDNGGRIIKIKVRPKSLKYPLENACADSSPMDIPNNLKGSSLTIQYTYSVVFLKDNTVKWSSRWDFLLESHSKIKWFSIPISLLIVLFLTGMVATVLLRTLRKDTTRYNKLESNDYAQEECSWKLVHEHVFSASRKRMFLAVFLGSGFQVFFVTLITLIFACFGFLSPANRGALMTCLIVLYICLGAPAGYVSARMYKGFKGNNWKLNFLLTSTFCPGCVFVLFSLMNWMLWFKGGSGATQFTLLILFSLWFGILLPLTFVGAYFGIKKTMIKPLVRTNLVARQIPTQSIFTHRITGIVMGGILPFGCMFIPLYHILSSICSGQVYYMFGQLLLAFISLVVACSEIAVLLCYFHLRAEDYRWWWRSFLTSGFSAFYLFLYCLYFYITKLNIADAVSTFLYFGYTLILVFLFFLLTGTIGFFACLWFVKKIYGGIIPSSVQTISESLKY